MVQINRRTVRQAALSSALLLIPGIATAQQFVPAGPGQTLDYGLTPQRNQRVQDRPRPDYDPLGIRAGSFFFFPSATIEGGFNSNVYAVEHDTTDDFFTDLTPVLDVRSNFTRHALSFQLANANRFYASETDNNSHDVAATTSGRLDITRSDIVSANLGVARRHEDNSSPDDAGLNEPTVFYTGNFDLGYRHNFNRLFTVANFAAMRWDFDSTQRDPSNDQDRWTYRWGGQVGYEVSPRFTLFGDGGYSVVRYDQRPDNDGFNRNSSGFDVGVGTIIDFTGVLWGQARVGYAEREYVDDDLDKVSGPGASTSLTWNATQLTTLELTVGGAILETTVIEDGEAASANLQKSIQFDVTHELRRNILITGSLGFIRDDFEGINRTDDYYQAGFGASYLLNRNLSIDANYNFDTRDSDANNNNYVRNIVRIGLTARM